MFISSLHVRHFRCIVDARLECEPLTALVGPNGCGKSTFLRALELFFLPDPKIADEDFYNRDTSTDIEITVEFRELVPAHTEVLQPYLQDSIVCVTRVFSASQGRAGNSFYGYVDGHEGFSELRLAQGATKQKEIYEELRSNASYDGLPKWTKQSNLPGSLNQWELSHPEQCVPQRDDGSFFGLASSARFDLRKLAQVVFVPAVRDAAADARDTRGTPITELLDIAFRSGMFERDDFRELQSDVEARYREIVDKAKQEEFQAVEERLSRAMGTFVSDAVIKFDWHQADKVRLPSPSADVLISQDGYNSPVDRTGHGVQRAFTLSLLQEIAAARLQPRDDLAEDELDHQEPLPVLLLMIEEPELFQYPNRQRTIARTLQELAQGAIPGVADRTQVLYGTHNPHFVSVREVEQVRVLSKQHLADGNPKTTVVRQFDKDVFISDLAACKDSGESAGEWSFHQMKLTSVMTPIVNEGLFAKFVVLVEGDIDRAGILAASSLAGLELEDLGVSVIPAGGKANLVRLSIIFRHLGIDVYVIWDVDSGKGGKPGEVARREKENRELYRLVGATVDEPPNTCIAERYACIESDLEQQVKQDLGEFYSNFVKTVHETYGMKASDAIKNQVVFEDMLRMAADQDTTSVTLDSIVERIRDMVA